MEYVIIGNSAAAVGAVESIRRVDRTGGLTVVSSEKDHVYSRPLIAHYLAGEIGAERMPYRPADFYAKNSVRTRLGVNVSEIDLLSGKLLLGDGTKLPYDRLLIATGSKTTALPFSGDDLDGVGSFQTYEDARKIISRLQKGKKAVVIGAGLIGIRAAYGLREAGAQVTIVKPRPRILRRVLDEKGSLLVQSILERHGIKVLTGHAVQEISGNNEAGVKEIILDNGEKIACNLVIVATGVTPNTGLVKNTPVKVNHGIVVNQFFQTTITNIFAAGDVAETYDIPRGKGMVNANWPNAYEQGKCAGLGMAGKMHPFPGSLGMNAVSFNTVPVISMGLFDPESEGVSDAEVKTRENFTNSIYQKLVFQDNRLKGAIFIGDLGYAGAVRDLIKEQALVGIIKDSVLEEKYQFYSFLRKYRQKHLEGTAIQWPETYSSPTRYEKSFNEESWTERERDKRSWR